MENKINAQFICMEEPSFYLLLDTLYARLKGKEKGDKWITSEEVMRLLSIKSPTTLQNLRNTGAFRFSQFSKKMIMYDRESIEEYLEKHAQKAWH